MAGYRNFHCPSCGAPGEVNRHIALGVCDYCGGAFYFKDEAVLLKGEMNVLAEPDSPLYVGATGQLGERRFSVLGRVRYRYGEGVWDEWFLQDEAFDTIWIGEDEGEFSLEAAIDDPGDLPPFDAIRPGMALTVGGVAVTVDEKDVAHLEGIEGHLPMDLAADRSFPYVDASQGEATVTIEYAADGIEAFRGTWIDLDDLCLDNPRDGGFDGGWSDA